MSLQDNDLFMVDRDGTQFQVKTQDMSNLKDTDLFWVQRDGVDYSVTADQVNTGGQPALPEIAGITLTEDSPGGDRFTDSSFTTTIAYTEQGNPAPVIGMKAKVSGALSIAGETSPITDVGSKVYVIGNPQISEPDGTFPGNPTTVVEVVPPETTFTNDGSINGPATMFDGTDAYCYLVTGNITVTEFQISLDAVGAVPGDMWGTNSTCGGDSPTYQPWSFIFCDENHTEIGDYTPLPERDGTTLQWLDSAIPVGAKYVKYKGVLLDTPYCQSVIAGFRINGTTLVSDDVVTLTLTDRTNLDNGAFVVGDVVTGYTQEAPPTPNNGPWEDGFRVRNYSESAAFDTGVVTSVSENETFAGTTGGPTLTFDRLAIGTGELTFTQTAGSNTFYVKAATAPDATFDVADTGWSTRTSFTVKMDSSSIENLSDPQYRYFNICSSGNTQGFYYTVKGTATGVVQEPVTVEAISTTADEMTVSGGNWEIGQTVKNTVVNPIIGKPESDVITQISAEEGVEIEYTSDMPVATNLWYDNSGTNDQYTFSWTGANVERGDYIRVISDYFHAGNLILTGDIEGGSVVYSAIPRGTFEGLDYESAGGSVKVTAPNGLVRISYTGFYGQCNFVQPGSIEEVTSPWGDTVAPKLDRTVLTLASSDGLGNFVNGYDVYQDSDYTAETSSINTVVETNGATPYPSDQAQTNKDVATIFALMGVTHITGIGIDNRGTDAYTTELQQFKIAGVRIMATNVVTTQGEPYSGSSWENWLNPNPQLSSVVQGQASETYSCTFDPVAVAGQTAVVSTLTKGAVYVLDQDGNKVYLLGGSNPSYTTLSFDDSTDLDVFKKGDVVQVDDLADWTTQDIFKVAGDYGNYWSLNGWANPRVANGGTWDTAPSNIMAIGIPRLLELGEEYDLTLTKTDAGDMLFQVYGNDNPNGSMDKNIDNVPGPIYISSTPGRTTPGIKQYNNIYAGGSGIMSFKIEGIVGGQYVKVVSVGPGNKMKLDGGTWSNGEKVSCTYAAATGTVASTSGSEMILSASDGRWMINRGKYVTGDPTPVLETSAYCIFDADGNVSRITQADPDYVNMIGNQNLNLSFGDDLGTGDTPDQELPPNTSLTTYVRAVNELGSSFATSNPVTPAVDSLRAQPDSVLQANFVDQATRWATIDNRYFIYQGEKARSEMSDNLDRITDKIVNYNEKQGK